MAIVTVKRIKGKPPCSRYRNGLVCLDFPLDQDTFEIEAGQLYYVLRRCNMEHVPDPVIVPLTQEIEPEQEEEEKE
jgi:hypothetical protein